MLQFYIMRVYHEGILCRFTMKHVMIACCNGILRAYAVKMCHQKRRDGIFQGCVLRVYCIDLT